MGSNYVALQQGTGSLNLGGSANWSIPVSFVANQTRQTSGSGRRWLALRISAIEFG